MAADKNQVKIRRELCEKHLDQVVQVFGIHLEKVQNSEIDDYSVFAVDSDDPNVIPQIQVCLYYL